MVDEEDYTAEFHTRAVDTAGRCPMCGLWVGLDEELIGYHSDDTGVGCAGSGRAPLEDLDARYDGTAILCPECGRFVRVDQDGRIGPHPQENRSGRPPARGVATCAGSGRES